MIIKSKSRETASFSQLISYMNKGRTENDKYLLRHNIYSYRHYDIVKEYLENHKKLKKRKNSLALFHEIISLKHQKNLTIEEQREILKDLAEQYIKARANNNLVYGVIHEQHNQVHVHLIISSNEIENNRNKRLSKMQFKETKKMMREYAYNKYPKIERLVSEETNTETKAKTKNIDDEVQYKKRTGKATDKEQIRDVITAIFAKTKTADDFVQLLRDAKLELYKRGKQFGFLNIGTGKKYRLQTLRLEEEFQNLNTRISNQSTNAKTGEETMNVQNDKKNEFYKAGQSTQYINGVRECLKAIFAKSNTQAELFINLIYNNFEIYQIHNSFGFRHINTGYKYRLKHYH
jgi:hypothetical protein